jgi:ABC-type polysaccharide/polyol phosphate transport system ATPase subunit
LVKISGDDVKDAVIEVSSVNLNYVIRHGRATTLKETAISAVKGVNLDITVNALVDINFTVNRGEVLAIIGHNGAGKSSLLKLIARVLPPTSGIVKVNGSVAPMLELGAGFNPELSGEENILLFGVLLGNRTKEMRSKVSEIAEWAGLSEQIKLPLRTYSTGMVARLGFAIATFRRSDVLIIDEILGVGDADFQIKSKARMMELISHGEATILVTHDLTTVEDLATKVLWLDHGRQKMIGPTNEVLDAYRQA